MRTTFLSALLVAMLTTACGKEAAPASTESVDRREPVAFLYVGAPELQVHASASETSPVVGKYINGESVSILAQGGEWVEVRTGSSSGWAKRADLQTAEEKQHAEENPEPRFRTMPAPVLATQAKGEIYIEADVNTEGEVTSFKVITNTTGSQLLAEQNGAALRQARFWPMVVKGEKKPFKYYYRVTY
jgi:uncharacterized protein YgiM (DUF1202 family)